MGGWTVAKGPGRGFKMLVVHVCVPEGGGAEGVRVVHLFLHPSLLVVHTANFSAIGPKARDTISIWLYSVKLADVFAESLKVVKLSFAAFPSALVYFVGGGGLRFLVWGGFQIHVMFSRRVLALSFIDGAPRWCHNYDSDTIRRRDRVS